jgi:hypothetical protein
MTQYIDMVKGWIYKNMSNPSFDNFSYFCGNYTNQPIRTFQNLKKHNTKAIGDIFEAFCKLYLIHVLNYDTVWFYNEIPADFKTQLKLTKRDMGIDILAINNGEICAIQCKYRNRNKKYTMVNWKDLSTFYALTSRTGPYDKVIVMTNADYVKKIGNKQDNEVVLSYKIFNNMKFENWFKMCQGFNHSVITNQCISVYSNGKQLGNGHNENVDNENVDNENVDVDNENVDNENVDNDNENVNVNDNVNENDNKSKKMNKKIDNKQFLREQRLKYFNQI